MDKFFAYLLLILIVCATWNDSLSNRLRRIVGGEAVALGSTARTSGDDSGSEDPVNVSHLVNPPAPKRTPFWEAPGYKPALDVTPKKKNK